MVSERHQIYATPTEIDNLLKAEIRGDSIIDSRNTNKKIKKLVKIMGKEDTSNFVKIKIADFLCHKLAEYYKFSQDKLEIIRENLFSAIFNGGELYIPVRLRFLRFKNENISYIFILL